MTDMGLSDLQLQHASFDLWISSEGEDNRVERERVKRMLPIVLNEVCTVTQKEYIMAFFVDRLTVTEIAEQYGVNKSTVSRTIHRGMDKAYSYLRFVSPLFMKIPQRRGSISKQFQKDWD